MGEMIRDHLCVVDLYLKHNEWRSQYIQAWMNYQKLGYRKFSDYLLLKDMIKFFGTSKIAKDQQWPVMRFGEPMNEAVAVRGLKQIINFIRQKDLIRYEMNEDAMNEVVERYIEQKIVLNLQSLFWHPRLTFENFFHTNIDSVVKESAPLRLVLMFHYNMYVSLKEIGRNLGKILRERERYVNSKGNVEKGLKEMVTFLEGRDYIGGQKPGHLDFYLFAVLSAKMNSKDFEKFLRNDIGGKIWDWIFRMRMITKYDKQRITLL